MTAHLWLPHRLPLLSANRASIDRCFCRYVSEPLFLPDDDDDESD